MSDSTVSRIERDRLDGVTITALGRVCGALGLRLDINVRLPGGDLVRMLDARHATMSEIVTRQLEALRWVVVPEVSFSIFGERGSIDLLAWHPESRTLLVVELKTEVLDLQGMLVVLDRKERLAAQIVRERGWIPASVGLWLVVADSSTNRRRVAEHRSVLRARLPSGIAAMRRWLRDPSSAMRALTFLAARREGSRTRPIASVRRVRRPAGARSG